MALRVSRKSIVITQIITVAAIVLTLACAFYALSLSAQRALAVAVPDMSDVTFTADSTYVRAGNGGDIAAQLKTPVLTEDVRFYLNGNHDAPIVGTHHKTTTKNQEWRLYTSIPAGKHEVTASVKVAGEWHDASAAATVYSLDMPAVSYVFPRTSGEVFRPGDNPLRIKAEDEFNQFDYAQFSLYEYDTAANKFGAHIDIFKIARDQCDLRAAGNYVLCDMAKASGWQNLAEGSYRVKLMTNTVAKNGARTDMNEYWSQVFTIDATPPTVSDFRIEGSSTVKDTLSVSALASDNTAVEDVLFYVTEPRASDGVCTGNGTKLVSQRVTAAAGDGRYYAELTLPADYTTVVSGNYCVNAMAGDTSKSHSSIQKRSFVVDRTPSEVTVDVVGSKTPEASSPLTLKGKITSGLADFQSLSLKIDSGDPIDITAAVNMATGEWQYVLDDGVTQGDHTITVTASDALGNVSTASVGVSATGYIPTEEESLIPEEVTRGLSEAFSDLTPPRIALLPAQLQTGTTTPATPDESDSDKSVLGAATETPDETTGTSAPVTPSSTGWTLLGLAWYWWLGATSGVAALGAGVTALIRRKMTVA